MTMLSGAKTLALSALQRLTGRPAVLLGPEAVPGALLATSAPYRVDGEVLPITIHAPGPGHLRAELAGYAGHFPSATLWRGERAASGPGTLELELTTGLVRWNREAWATVPLPLPGRRFAWHLAWHSPTGLQRTTTGHYLPAGSTLPAAPPPTEGGYFTGQNYVDYEAESAGEAATILQQLDAAGARGPVLEVGCATGAVLAALSVSGREAWGLDISPWAVAEANRRLAPDAPRAFVADVAQDSFPPEILVRAPFGALVLWMVFEHFAEPFAVLERLGSLLAPGATLVLGTTNAGSLTHELFGRDWEGYFDGTHLGVDAVSVASLRERLPALGWEIRELSTHRLWTRCADPHHASLREWFTADARFRALLASTDRGDLITCIALRV